MSPRRHVAPFWLALLAWALAPEAPALACSCVLPPLATAREDASALFEGRVLEIADVHMDAGATNGERKVTLAVVRSWKGLERDERVVVFTNGSSAACGYTFAQDTSYLVYARAQRGRLEVSSCSRTRPLADAAEDLAQLGAGSTPVRIGARAPRPDAGSAARSAAPGAHQAGGIAKTTAHPAATDAGVHEAGSARSTNRGCTVAASPAAAGASWLLATAWGLVVRRQLRRRRGA